MFSGRYGVADREAWSGQLCGERVEGFSGLKELVWRWISSLAEDRVEKRVDVRNEFKRVDRPCRVSRVGVESAF